LTELIDDSGAAYHITEKYCDGEAIRAEFIGELKEEQKSAVISMLKNNNGVLHGATAFGKTVIGNYMISEVKVNTLIIVPNGKLMEQWKKSLEQFLVIDHVLPEAIPKRGRPKKQEIIGLLGDGKNTRNGIIDIAIYKSLLEGDDAKDFVGDYGMVIVDECHHVGAYSYEQVLNSVYAKCVYGVTATPIRSDGLDAQIFFHCGPIRFKTDTKAQIKEHGFDHVMTPRFTQVRPLVLTSLNNMPMIYNELAVIESRNRKIIDDIVGAVSESRTPLVLTERVEHVLLLAKVLEEELSDENIEVVKLFGGLSKKEKMMENERLSSMQQDQRFIIVATSQYIGEGFDLPALDTLFLAMPIKWKGRLEQYIGRLHRKKEGKTEARVYDYVDIHVPVLERMYRVRLKGYATFGYSVMADMSDFKNISMIYAANNYQDALRQDLQETAKCLMIAGTKYTKKQIANIESSLPEIGITTEIQKLDLHFIVIDRRIVWYGDINFFGGNDGDETCLRLDNRELAEEMLSFV
jgi:superfamily II DNA or RNA helicase